MINLAIRQILRVCYQLKIVFNKLFKPIAYGVYVAVWYKGNLLIIKNSYKTVYTLPCGGIKKGETLLEAASRELYEEVGLTVSVNNLIPYACYYSEVEYMSDYVTLFEVYLTASPVLCIDEREVVLAEFMSDSQICNLKTFKILKDYLHDKHKLDIN